MMSIAFAMLRKTLFACFCAVSVSCAADSALPMLSGFDAKRIDAAYPPVDEDSAGELAKLIYRLDLADASVLESKAGNSVDLGDAIWIEGQIRELRSLEVPQRLIEFLELSQLHVVVIAVDGLEQRIVSKPLPDGVKSGDRVRGVGVVIQSGDPSPVAVACARLRWFPETTDNVGWRLLGDAGVDVSLITDIRTRDRRPLVADDGDAFYSMLAAADGISDRQDLPPPGRVDPVDLLRSEDDLGGNWLTMELETVQVTRIAVTDARRQAQLGSDHYFQIDAVGDLGNVIVKIERPQGEAGPPAIFENRYPVSLVARDLPDFLENRIRISEGGEAVVAQIKLLIGVDAFFYRIWSYSTDYMNQHGGGDQFGPLLIAAEIRNREPVSDDPAGVGVIGWIAAVAVIVAILMIWAWNRRLATRDREVRQQRKDREAEQLQLP